MYDTPENRKLVKKSFLRGIKERGLDDWLNEMVAHWLRWEQFQERVKKAFEEQS